MLMATKKDAHPLHRPKKHHVLLAWACISILLAGIGGASWAIAFYQDHVLPNIMVGNKSVGQSDAAAVRRAIEYQANLKATFSDGNKTVTVPFATLGVQIDVAATVQQVMQARRSPDWLTNIEIWKTVEVPLVFTNDWGKLKLFVQQEYPATYGDAADATISYDTTTSTFVINGGSQGKGFDLRQFETALPVLAQHPRNVSLSLQTKPVEPLITASGLTNVTKIANQRLGLSLQFLLQNKVVYQVAAADIASWAFFTPDATKGSASLDFDQAKIEQFVTSQLGAKVATLPVDKKVVVDQQSGEQTVIQAGKPGQMVANPDEITQTIYKALQNNQPLEQPITVVDAPFKIVTLTGSGKWIEVDLSHQATTLWVGNIPIQTFLISSGKARTPTEIGTFHIYRKYAVKTMTGTILGEYYYIPNIPWVSFFDGGEAFHGTYWHHNFGHPMSHGCINMTIPDAKVLYDFAPVGTKVVVHA